MDDRRRGTLSKHYHEQRQRERVATGSPGSRARRLEVATARASTSFLTTSTARLKKSFAYGLITCEKGRELCRMCSVSDTKVARHPPRGLETRAGRGAAHTPSTHVVEREPVHDFNDHVPQLVVLVLDLGLKTVVERTRLKGTFCA